MQRANTPVEDQPLILAIDDARSRNPLSNAAAAQLLDDFTQLPAGLRQWIFDLCDPARHASPFVTRDDLAALMRELLTGRLDRGERWANLTRQERRQALRVERFVQDKRRAWIGAGRPHDVDRALILYVIRRIEEATGVVFRFSRPGRQKRLGGPMLRLAEAALHQLFHILPDWLSPAATARHYTRAEIAFTAELDRRASNTSPVKWPADWILAFTSDVRSELVRAGRQRPTPQPPNAAPARPRRMVLVAERTLPDRPEVPAAWAATSN